ncbi:MAG: baseplate J/gp47 family protein [Chloroflexi bacterium]|nr:baseplate J/gp47 family protein [Chloroflexota bacterium]
MATASATPPAAAQEVVFLDLDDDLTTVRAKLESTSADEVYLVIPRRSPILRTPLEFRILARLTHELSSETIIVTGDGSRRALARQEGLRTRRSVRSLRHLSRPPGSHSWGLPALPDWIPLPSLTGLLFSVIVGAAIVFLVLGVLPVMKVTIAPQVLPQQQDIEIMVDPSARQSDVARRIVPGEVLQQRVEVVGSLPVSGGKKLGRDRARGEVVFLSQNNQPITLPRGTIVSTNSGVRFQTDLDVQVPAWSQGLAKVGVTAVDPGTAGNVEARQITRIDTQGIQNLTARNDRPTQGGTDRDGKVVTQDDIAKLREQLQSRAREQALAELYARAGSDRSLVQQSLRLRPENESFDPGVDAEADQVTGKLSMVTSAVVFLNADFNGMVQKVFLAQAGPGFDLPISQLGVGTPEVLGVDDQKVRIRTRSQAGLVRQVNGDQIAEQLRWKPLSEARSILSRTDGVAGSPRIEMSPEWALRAYRIEVTVQNPK